MADQQSSEDLRSEVQQLRTDLRTLTETVRNLAAEQGERAQETVRESLASARTRAVRAEKAVEGQIETRPMTSVLLCFVGGLITGLLLQSRR
jgi:ElaB/YqjD/DUF883 family membrane-anchored ribosome-binding protein